MPASINSSTLLSIAPIITLMIQLTIKTIIKTSLNCDKNLTNSLFFFLPTSRFLPFLSSLFCASIEDSPDKELFTSSKTSSLLLSKATII